MISIRLVESRKAIVPFESVCPGDTFVVNGKYSKVVYRKLHSEIVSTSGNKYNAAIVGGNNSVICLVEDNELVWLVDVNMEFSLR